MSVRRLALLAAVAVLAVAGVALAAKGGSSSVTLCAQGDAGALRLAKGGKCAPGERRIAIAKQGPQGAPGAPGPAGAAGPAGADASAAALAPEPVRFVEPSPGPEMSCATTFGTFCSYSAVQYGNETGGYVKTGYFKDSSGVVHLQGMTKWVCNNACNGAAYGNTIFYLPPGYRPTEGKLEFPIRRCTNESGEDIENVRTVQVATDGAVSLSTAGCGVDSLDGISFYP